MLQGQFVVLGVALLPSVNHAVDVLTRIVAEADVLVSFQQVVHHLRDCPLADVLSVQSVVELHNSLGAVVHYKGVFDFIGLGQFLSGNHLVGLDVSVFRPMRHPDIDLQESVLTHTAHCWFECCHFFRVPIFLVDKFSIAVISIGVTDSCTCTRCCTLLYVTLEKVCTFLYVFPRICTHKVMPNERTP